MTNSSRLRQIETKGLLTGREGAIAFLDAIRDAPNDTDIEIRGGTICETGQAAILCSIGAVRAALSRSEALRLADIAERTMWQFPNERGAATLPDLILALRGVVGRLGDRP